MKQGSDEWLNWRGRGIGSSDAPIIMGVSPFKTVQELYEEKTNKEKKERYQNDAMARGSRLEGPARAYVEIHTSIDFEPGVHTHGVYDFIRASTDGWNEALGIVLEIKCPGKADHGTARSGQVPKKYYPQLQHLLLVTGGRGLLYFSYDGRGGHLIKVDNDFEYQEKLLQKEIKFWDCVVSRTPQSLGSL